MGNQDEPVLYIEFVPKADRYIEANPGFDRIRGVEQDRIQGCAQRATASKRSTKNI